MRRDQWNRGGGCAKMSGFNKVGFFEPEDDTSTFERNPGLFVNTPSRAEGVDERTETMLRVYGCELIQEAGILLRMHQTAIVTGQIIFHRFYFRISMKRCDVRGVAKAALMLGGKIEEQPRKMHDILNVFHAAALRRHNRKVEPLVAGTKRYFELKEDILNAEQAILRELGFIIHAEHAHKFVFYYIRVLLAKGFNEQYPELAQKAWNYANDLYRSSLCLKFRPNVLACASIFLASRDLKIPLPEPTWWELFDAKQEQVFEVATAILGLYKLPKAKHINLKGEPDKEEAALAVADASAAAATSSLAHGAGEGEDRDQVGAQNGETGAETVTLKAKTPDAAAADKTARDKADAASEPERGPGGGSKDERRSPGLDRRRDNGSRDLRDREEDRRRDREDERRRDRSRSRSRERDRGGDRRGGGDRQRSPPGRRGSDRRRSSSPVRRRSRSPDRRRMGGGRDGFGRGSRDKGRDAPSPERRSGPQAGGGGRSPERKGAGRERPRDARDRDRGGQRGGSKSRSRSPSGPQGPPGLKSRAGGQVDGGTGTESDAKHSAGKEGAGVEGSTEESTQKRHEATRDAAVSEEDKRRKRQEKFGTAKAGSSVTQQGASETAAVTAAGASGNDDGPGQESARKKDRIKVRIGQRDDLQNAH